MPCPLHIIPLDILVNLLLPEEITKITPSESRYRTEIPQSWWVNFNHSRTHDTSQNDPVKRLPWDSTITSL